ncbi:MBL fold metallo-hydrolase [Nitratifractor sp.]
MLRLNIVFDNYRYREDLESLWGFSCFIERPEGNLLFDTGSNGRVLLRNIARMGLELTLLNTLVISHPHWDHIGGIDSVLELAPHLELYVPASLSRHYIRDLTGECASLTVVEEAPVPVAEGIRSTGIMGEIGEQSLLLETEEGLVVLTGCAHPGVVAICERAMEMTGRRIRLLMGGFHLMYSDEKTILATIAALGELGVASVCPTHCSGDLAIGFFREVYGDAYLRGGVGRVISL